MTIGKFLLAGAVGSALVFGGSAVPQSKSAFGEDAAIVKAIRDNCTALQKEDIAAYMKTLDMRSPQYDTTKGMIAKLVEIYDLSYKLGKVEVVSRKPNEAKVRFELTTTKVRGPEFRDNRVKGITTLKKRSGEWKLYTTQILTIDYLN